MGLESHEFLQLTKSSALKSGQTESSLPVEFLRSAAYAGIEAPARAIAQLAGASADESLQKGFQFIGVEAPQKAEFGTGRWYAQHLGGAFGMALPFLALRAGVERASGNLLPAGFTATAGDSMLKSALRESAITGTSGFLYGAALSPSRETKRNGWDLLKDRVKNGAADAATFATLGFATPYLARGLSGLGSAAESSALPKMLSTRAADILRSPITAGIGSGLPAGLAAAEANALKEGRHASLQELKENITSMSFVGGVFAGAGRYLETRLKDSTQTKEAISTSTREQALQADPHPFPPEINTALLAANKRLEAQILEAEVRARAESVFARLDKLKPQEALAKTREEAPATGDSSVKSVNDKVKADNSTQLPGLDIVLGASGIEAPAHAGFLRAIEERNVAVATITGVSGGSLVATLFANKYSASQIKDILLSDQFRYPRADIMAKCLHLTDPWNLFPYSMDFRPWLQDFVDTYKLKPQENLRIVAADKETHAAVVFEGTKYDLVEALAASTAATNGLSIKPINYKGRELIDGFYYHPTPADLAKAPALVSKIGFVHKLPSEHLSPWDYFMHLREMSYYESFKKRFPDPPGHIIAETGLPDVATTTFGVSKETLMKLVEHGYESTSTRLNQADALKAIKDAQTERHVR